MYRIFFILVRIVSTGHNFFVKTTQPTATVVLYHRVQTVTSDPLMLCVPESVFESHLVFYTKFYNVVSLEELNSKMTQGTLTGKELAITFDDGYVDNLTHALPLLEKYNLPVTIFIATSQLGSKASYTWDKQYSEVERATFLSTDEITQLQAHPLVTIGAHTHTHARLSELTKEEQLQDMQKGNKILESTTGKPVQYFAYPFGGRYDINEDSFQSAKDSGYTAAYLNTQKYVTKKTNPYKISRFNIRSYTTLQLALTLLTFSYFVCRIKAYFVKNNNKVNQKIYENI
jgi:peptidoglycan/xylan/chitin deacetylase (PgdA/CDA1 family)